MHGSGWGATRPARVGPGSPEADLEAAAAFLEGGIDPSPGRTADLFDDGPGPWFEAEYEGNCSGCDEYHIEPGDRIRADGLGGYEHEDCADDD